jgi:hypothetical protein
MVRTGCRKPPIAITIGHGIGSPARSGSVGVPSVYAGSCQPSCQDMVIAVTGNHLTQQSAAPTKEAAQQVAEISAADADA